MRLVAARSYDWGELHMAIALANSTLGAYVEVPRPESGLPGWSLGRVDPAARLTPPARASAALRAALPGAEAARDAINRQLDEVMRVAPPERWLPEWGDGEARAYIAAIGGEGKKKWQHSRPPQPPHRYTVRDWRPDLRRDFLAFAQLIQSRGSLKTWGRRVDAYLELDRLEYWTMGSRIQETGVINRAPVDAPDAAKPLSNLTPEQLRRAVEQTLANRRSAGEMVGRTGILDLRLRTLLDASDVG